MGRRRRPEAPLRPPNRNPSLLAGKARSGSGQVDFASFLGRNAQSGGDEFRCVHIIGNGVDGKGKDEVRVVQDVLYGTGNRLDPLQPLGLQVQRDTSVIAIELVAKRRPAKDAGMARRFDVATALVTKDEGQDLPIEIHVRHRQPKKDPGAFRRPGSVSECSVRTVTPPS